MSNDLLNKILEKQEKISEDILDMKIIQALQEENLKVHIKRTDLAEENIQLLREELRIELQPLKTRYNQIDGALKLVGGLAILATFITTVFKIVGYISSI